MSAVETDLWVFRDGRKSVSGTSLLHELQRGLKKLLDSPRPRIHERCLNALIRAGELESALADAGSPAVSALTSLTDALALALLNGDLSTVRKLTGSLSNLSPPQTIETSPPEGFSYYALHPLDFADAAIRMANEGRSIPGSPVAVIGIRSIGTTLSAVAAATLRRTGRPAERITVRPTGHPYSRITDFTSKQIQWIEKQKQRSATFLVVDEGPGRSGSSFLSVGEALIDAGVPAEHVTLIGSHEPDLNLLCADDASLRWKAFRFLAAVPHICARFSDHIFVGSGEWRRTFLAEDTAWPACWPQMERAKLLSPDGTRLYKFEGLGAVGEAVQQRSRRVDDAGFGCSVTDAADGFSCYAVAEATPMTSEDADLMVLDRMAQYCAFRAAEFGTDGTPEPLAEMLRFNISREFQIELNLNLDALQPSRLVVVDGRMQPHEWLRTSDGIVLKTDASTHGDDHFFPGPTDIAWDLAGIAVEWNLHPDALEFLLTRFAQLTSNDLRRRLPILMLAYSGFRLAWCKMATSTVVESSEQLRLRTAYRRYRSLALIQMSRLGIRGPAAPREQLSLV
jgi:hypothetical protein